LFGGGRKDVMTVMEMVGMQMPVVVISVQDVKELVL
jgi:hypothetical protein